MADKRKAETFVPELDGHGQVKSPVDCKVLKRINAHSKNSAFGDALKKALEAARQSPDADAED